MTRRCIIAREGHTVVGSGIKPQIDINCTNSVSSKRHLTGTAVAVINPEDASAGGPFRASMIEVTTSATLIPTVGLEYRRSIAIRNNGASTVFLGHDSTVTTSDGFPLKPDEIFHADVTGDVPIFGIAAATVEVRVMELK